jgi:hypothetical protein
MVFTRTVSGLANQPLFMDCDLIIYVEGTPHACFEAAGGVEGDVCNYDSFFWASIVTACRPELRHRFKPFGSKKSLLELARGLDGERVKGKILVAIDRDFDGAAGSEEKIPCLVRSASYSWESDVWGVSSVHDVLLNWLPMSMLPPHAATEIDGCVSAFWSRVTRYSWGDAALFALNNDGLLFDRESPSRFIDLTVELPRLKERDLRRHAMAMAKSLGKGTAIPKLVGFDTKRHTFGKKVRDFHVAVLRAAGRKYLGNFPPSNHYLWMQGLQAFKTRLMSGNEANLAYYRSEVDTAMGLAA